MPLPDPAPGLVVRYGYLWRDEARRGQEEGRKDRPCVVVLSVKNVEGQKIVTVAPVTHTRPKIAADGVEFPAATKKRLGLDDQPSWIMSSELNRFLWPGPDLRPIERGQRTFAYGFSPDAMLQALRRQIVAHGRNPPVDRG